MGFVSRSFINLSFYIEAFLTRASPREAVSRGFQSGDLATGVFVIRGLSSSGFFTAVVCSQGLRNMFLLNRAFFTREFSMVFFVSDFVNRKFDCCR